MLLGRYCDTLACCWGVTAIHWHVAGALLRYTGMLLGRYCDTLACYWGVKQPSNKPTNQQTISAFRNLMLFKTPVLFSLDLHFRSLHRSQVTNWATFFFFCCHRHTCHVTVFPLLVTSQLSRRQISPKFITPQLSKNPFPHFSSRHNPDAPPPSYTPSPPPPPPPPPPTPRP